MKMQRPEVIEGQTVCMKTGCGNIYITVNLMDGQPFEVFLNMGKAGGCAFAQCESIGRLISYALRIGGSAKEIVKEIKGIRCHNCSPESLSCADATAHVLEMLCAKVKDSSIQPLYEKFGISQSEYEFAVG